MPTVAMAIRILLCRCRYSDTEKPISVAGYAEARKASDCGRDVISELPENCEISVDEVDGSIGMTGLSGRYPTGSSSSESRCKQPLQRGVQAERRIGQVIAALLHRDQPSGGEFI